MSNLTDENYSEYLTTVRANLSDTFAKYDNKFGAMTLQRATVLGPASGKRKTMLGEKIMLVATLQVVDLVLVPV